MTVTVACRGLVRVALQVVEMVVQHPQLNMDCRHTAQRWKREEVHRVWPLIIKFTICRESRTSS